MKNFILCNLLVLIFSAYAYSYSITVDAHAEECFFDKVEYGTKMGQLKHCVGIYGRVFTLETRINAPEIPPTILTSQILTSKQDFSKTVSTTLSPSQV